MKLFHNKTNKRKELFEMLKDFFKVFKRSRKTKKPKAIAFVDFENWFLSLKKSSDQWADFVLSHRKKSRPEICLLGERGKYSLKELKKQQKKMIFG